MPKIIRLYVRYVEATSRGLGLIAMYLIFAMIAVLMYSSISKTFFTPSLWTLEVAQFIMMAYFLLGGGYSLLIGSHVRMDLAYGRWSEKSRAVTDSITIFCLIFFLAILLLGGINSTMYALKYTEVSRSIWEPQMAPIKIIMNIGIFLTLLQAIAIFFKSLATAMGRDIT
jgi:TRAP-type mannitol/chloroaromatic compound transport system permease small subunit